MRLFISLEVPERVRQNLKDSSESFLDKGADLRLVDAKRMHLTLKFLGDYPESKIVNLKNRLEKISFEEFSLTIKGLGVFPEKGNPRVIWAGFAKNDLLDELAEKVDLATPEVKRDKPSFKPHLTLARVKQVNDLAAFKRFLRSVELPEHDFKVGSFSLVSSVLTPEGPVYEVLERFTAKAL